MASVLGKTMERLDAANMVDTLLAALAAGPEQPTSNKRRAVCTTAVAMLLHKLAPEEPSAFGAGQLQAMDVPELETLLECEGLLIGLLCEPSFLFSRRREIEALRLGLVNRGRLWAVIELPRGLLRPVSAIPLCLLVVGPPDSATHISFVQRNTPEPALAAWDARSLAQLVLAGSDQWWVQRTPSSEAGVHADLNVRRYVRTPEEKTIDGYYEGGEGTTLGDAMQVVPAMPRTGTAGTRIAALQFVAGDLARFGTASTPTQRYDLPDWAATLWSQRFLRAGDILVHWSRSDGPRIGVVSAAAPVPGDGGWVAARAVWVFRLRPDCRLDARVLAMFLASPLGLMELDSVLHGRELINASCLSGIRLPRIDAEHAGSCISSFENYSELEQQAAALRSQQASLLQGLWSLAPIRAES